TGAGYHPPVSGDRAAPHDASAETGRGQDRDAGPSSARSPAPGEADQEPAGRPGSPESGRSGSDRSEIPSPSGDKAAPAGRPPAGSDGSTWRTRDTIGVRPTHRPPAARPNQASVPPGVRGATERRGGTARRAAG